MKPLSFSTDELDALAVHFEALTVKVPLCPITTPEEYDASIRVMDALLDAGAANEEHPLAGLVAALGEFIGSYDGLHHRLTEG